MCFASRIGKKQEQVEKTPTAGEIRAIYHQNKDKELEREDYKLKAVLFYLKKTAQEGDSQIGYRGLTGATLKSLRDMGFKCEDVGEGLIIITIC